MSLLTFMVILISATLLVLIVHEIGHIIPIIVFNVLEKRPFYYFSIEINAKYFYVNHEKFDKHYKNLIVAICGSLFPILVSVIVVTIIDNQFTNLVTLLSFGNLLMLHPKLPDGRNIINILKEMRERNGKSI
ncbi:hypothetical protein [Oceanobacillus chungangensis]|uniref:Peptidase M50 domain-containing protein n=1 Tax=Oceanobacillus chungangensis TaxID=1229152 RepID=A0A3D8Q033_9BACI|nr:hypothetical protein [Oceanobacillus chungangensis]RDW20779.1 hypothetical protein CWR45_06020 [Oceanobacillus chungangensis]